MLHLGILAHSAEGAALCFRAFCQEGFRRLGPDDHPDVTLDCIALARSMAAWDAGDHASIRATLSVSVRRLAGAGADFFACPDNTAHMALEQPGEELALPGLHIAEVVADQAARDGRTRVGVLGTRYTMEGPVYPRAFASRGIAAEVPEAGDRQIINKIIFEELVNGGLTASDRYGRGPMGRAPAGTDAVHASRACCSVVLTCLAPEQNVPIQQGNWLVDESRRQLKLLLVASDAVKSWMEIACANSE